MRNELVESNRALSGVSTTDYAIKKHVETTQNGVRRASANKNNPLRNKLTAWVRCGIGHAETAANAAANAVSAIFLFVL